MGVWRVALAVWLVAAGCGADGGRGDERRPQTDGRFPRDGLPRLPGGGAGGTGGTGGGGPPTLADRIREDARAAGLDTLRGAQVPEPPNLDDFLQDGTAARESAIVLGKALFWDTQVGSDGLACASCHFAAGADNRVRNQINPGTNGADEEWGGDGVPFAPNHVLTADDFPLRTYEDPKDRRSELLRDTNDVISSQGVYRGTWLGLSPDGTAEMGTALEDPVFQFDGANVRRVEPRNTPSVINAVFNAANFWDGRGHAIFNGASPFGPADEKAGAFVVRDGALVKEPVRIPEASLASQAVGPPVNDTEMSLAGRPFALIARRLLAARPLAHQVVHPDDSVLGGRVDPSGRGIGGTYADLVRAAFRPAWWESSTRVVNDAAGLRVAAAADAANPNTVSQMEANFSLFFGLAIQLYEATLVSDRTPFDAFMEGDDTALSPNALTGLASFVGQANCVACHAGPEFTNASARAVQAGAFEVRKMSDVRPSGALLAGEASAFLDRGFANIGVRPAAEDPGRGGVDEFGKPLSFVRQALAGLAFAPAPLACTEGEVPCPVANRVAVDGAFKVPGLRNVELTGPYFHNGGSATLAQVMDFYVRRGDFSEENLADVDDRLAEVSLHDGDEPPLVDFLLALTDERVRNDEAPFDHPQILVPNGHAGPPLDCRREGDPIYACDDLLEIPAVGRAGRTAAGLEPLGPFLGLQQQYGDDDGGEDPEEEEDL